MKPYLIICALALASCAGSGSKNGGDNLQADSGKKDTSAATKLNTPAQNMEYCFIHTDGKSAKDITAIHLVINANKVSGDMNWLPKEKDRRKGTLSGSLEGDNIKAVWSFMQEGTKDTLAVEFKLSAQQLAQKPMILSTKTGREQVNTKADYSVIYKLDNCEKFRSK
ncbi:hypothetical protein [Mucilaginibacter glaciei]|uniref:Uncharacterized protein n=1 Tax=Mucilaginibacter glaciei TaxID=2772109 RepID=A0A926S484_9SPHI|nr:hypothetical protein [Mucilaginibacter glaciei]MBD1395019.1 hypothetical protein [Mucilaginibacter glaciei]